MWGVCWYRRRGRRPHRRRVTGGQTTVVAVECGRTVMTGGVALLVTLCLKMNFLFFRNGLNSVCFCYFCIELIRAPKIMKLFVWLLCNVYFLGKILNIDFKYFFNVIKIAQLINKWVFMNFLGLFIYSKIMKIVLPLSYHEMNMYKKNLGLIGTSWFIS